MERKNKNSLMKFILCVLLNAAVLLIALLVFHPFFEEIDDTNICLIVEGTFGLRDWHIIYPNFLLGKLYVFLHSFLPMVRWHVVLQYVFIFIGYVCVMYVISSHKRGMLISVVALLSTFYEMYVSLQYTKTASFTCAAGFIILFEYIRSKTSFKNANDLMLKSKDKPTAMDRALAACAYILILYGMLLRPESLLIAAVPGLFAGVLELFRTKNIKRYLIMFLPVILIFFAARFADSYMYSMDSEWDSFMKYNKARMQVNDYRYDILDFNRYEKELNELNVSKNDALAILTYQFGDDNVFTTERFLEIRNAFPDKEFGYTVFANLFENLVAEVIRSYTLLTGLLGMFIVVIASIVTDRSKSSPGFIKDSRRKCIALILIVLSCFASSVYFQYSGRFSHRLIGSLLIPAVFYLCYMIDSLYTKENESKIVFGGNKNDVTMAAGIFICVALLCLNGLLYMGNVKDYSEYIAGDAKMLKELDGILNDKESLFVADTFTFQNIFKYDVFTASKEGALDNFVTCGSWYINSPITKRVTKRFGYENPFDALRKSDENVYLLDNGNAACKTLFLNEHYDNVYKSESIENSGKINGEINVMRVIDTSVD